MSSLREAGEEANGASPEGLPEAALDRKALVKEARQVETAAQRAGCLRNCWWFQEACGQAGCGEGGE